ncbi:(2Fe-2S)-binding protein [Candidatus Woesearchaeota archaeon]|nr:MAG: (2Fe-2S)-binding protein [Candidatus Woesearchaeota archaeon]
MAKLDYEDKEVEVKDDEKIVEQLMEFGVPFGCQDGLCGTCRLKILEGAENCTPLTEAEKAMGDRDEHNRLGCQLKIKGGKVKITF